MKARDYGDLVEPSPSESRAERAQGIECTLQTEARRRYMDLRKSVSSDPASLPRIVCGLARGLSTSRVVMTCEGEGVFVRTKTPNGERYHLECAECRRFIPYHFGAWPRRDFSDRQVTLMVARGGAMQECMVCGLVANLEIHHTAPSHIFGSECNAWPLVAVCYDCHRSWHDKVDLPRSTSTGHRPMTTKTDKGRAR